MRFTAVAFVAALAVVGFEMSHFAQSTHTGATVQMADIAYPLKPRVDQMADIAYPLKPRVDQMADIAYPLKPRVELAMVINASGSLVA
jgi:hypothetical protein